MKNFIGLLLLLISTFASGQEFKKKIPSYRYLYVSRGVEAHLVYSDADEVTIRTKGLQPEDIIVEGGHDELRIKVATKGLWQEMQDNYWWVKVEIPYQQLEGIEVKTGAKVWSDKPLRVGRLDMQVSMGARADLTLEADDLSLEATMGSIVELAGSADYLNVETSMGAEADLRKLKAGKVRAKANMGSQLQVTAMEEFDGQASMGSEIHLFGNPERFYRSTSMGGEIIRH